MQAGVRVALAKAGVLADQLILCACSHGPDSLALAELLVAVHKKVALVYVNHGLRPEAGAEGERVLAFAKTRGVEGRVVHAPVGEGRGPEDAARVARYAALDALADEIGAAWIALGHTRSDQSETVLMRLLRGSGAAGLAGIPARRGRFIRPLLDFTRTDVEAYLAAHDLHPSHDASNDSPAFLRNRVRHKLLPALRLENPSIDEALARTARAMRELSDGLDWAADQALAQISRGDPTEKRVDAAALARLPPAVAKRVITWLIPRLEARHLDAILDLAATTGGRSRRLDLPDRSIWLEYGELLLETGPPSEPIVDIEGDGGPYFTRRWQPGDRMKPARLAGHSRKLQDLLTDGKIPRRLRATAIVVVRESDQEIVWAEHVGAAVGVSLRVALTRH